MASLTSAVNVMVDSETKKQATTILNDLGLSMSTAINMFLKQVVKQDGLPFEVRNPKPTRRLKKALKESDKVYKELLSGKRKGFKNMDDLIKSLED